MIEVRKNEALSGIEVIFDEKPDVEVRAALKEAGFRWHRINKFWYAKETPERLEIAENLGVVLNDVVNIVSIFST